MKMIGIWLATFLFSLGNSLPLPTTSKVETIKVVNQEFAELRKISPQMELTEWSIKGNDLMKSQAKYNQGLISAQVKKLFEFDIKGDKTMIWSDACDYGAYGQFTVFDKYYCFLILSEAINEEVPEMEERRIWLCSMNEAGELVDYRVVASYTNISEGMDLGKVITTRDFTHVAEHGFAHYQDTETCPDPKDCKTFTYEQHQLTYFEDGTISE